MPGARIRCVNCLREGDLADGVCPSCGTAYPGARGTEDRPIGTPVSGGGASRDRLIERLRKVTVGRFDIIRLLGKGGMAAVYLAYDLRLDRKVALKVMLPSLEFEEGMQERFAREARTAARLTHANIMVVHDVIELDDLVLLVMNLISGASLEQVVSCFAEVPGLGPRQLPVDVAQMVLAQVASALDYAHSERVVHRDIKPSNVMINTKGDAIITDFGIAKVTADLALTKKSLVMGTPTYMSPEQWKEQPVTGASDQYSLGIMAYELLVGEPPFLGSMKDVCSAHLETEPPAIQLRRPDVPPKLAAAIARTLAKRPAERFATMGGFREAVIEGFDAGAPGPRRAVVAAAALAMSLRDQLDANAFMTPPSPTPFVPPPSVPTTISVIAPGSVSVGESFTVLASARDAAGNAVPGVTIDFMSEQPGVVSMTGAKGTAIADGRARIIARAGALWGDTHVNVGAQRERRREDDRTRRERVVRRVAVIRMEQPPSEVKVGATFTLKAIPQTEHGLTLDSRPIRWTSDHPTVATVDDNGTARAIGAGRVKFTAECDGMTATAVTIVSPESGKVAPAPEPDPRGHEAFFEEQTHHERDTAPIVPRPKPPKPPEPSGAKKWPWVLAVVALLIAGGVYWRVKQSRSAAAVTGDGASATQPAKPLFGDGVIAEIDKIGYQFGTSNIVEDFSTPQNYVSNGRLAPPAQTGVLTTDAWNVHSEAFVAHVDVRAEGAPKGGRRTGAGISIAAADQPDKRFYAVLVRGGASPDARVVQVSDQETIDVGRVTPITNDPSGVINLDVLVYQGGIHIYVNNKEISTQPVSSKYVLGGQFGLYALAGDAYSFGHLAVSAINVK